MFKKYKKQRIQNEYGARRNHNRIRSGIKNKDPRAEIFLYGSRARGDNRPDSDWDILVITPRDKITFDYETELRDPILDLELKTGQIISLIVYTRTDWTRKMMYSSLFCIFGIL